MVFSLFFFFFSFEKNVRKKFQFIAPTVRRVNRSREPKITSFSSGSKYWFSNIELEAVVNFKTIKAKDSKEVWNHEKGSIEFPNRLIKLKVWFLVYSVDSGIDLKTHRNSSLRTHVKNNWTEYRSRCYPKAPAHTLEPLQYQTLYQRLPIVSMY